VHSDRAAAEPGRADPGLHDTAAPLAGTTDLQDLLLRLRWRAAALLGQLGDNAELAAGTGEALLADHDRVPGPDHPATLASRNNVALAYQAAGRPATPNGSAPAVRHLPTAYIVRSALREIAAASPRSPPTPARRRARNAELNDPADPAVGG
jgi:hypothetical protein